MRVCTKHLHSHFSRSFDWSYFCLLTMYFKGSVVVWCAVLLIAFTCWMNAEVGEALGTLGLNIHHRYSDSVRAYLGVDGLPEKDTLDYFAAMAHRDKLFFNGRRLADSPSSSSNLTFLGSNQTFHVLSLGFLHYAFIRVGTPSLRFIVALDTGGDLFWLPCDCTTCVRQFNTTSGTLDLNIYSPLNSSTSVLLPCNSTLCGPERACLENVCAYEEGFITANTSSTGILVNDVLHLGTDSSPQDLVDVPITLGCGLVQTGDFIRSTAINGLLGLGMDNISVPSILANKGLTANSFSMCFGRNRTGRIEFGDKGSPDQEVTSFNIGSLRPTYNVTMTQISVGNDITNLEFTAIFDSGSAFTHLMDPAYSAIANSFNSQVTDPPYQPPQKIIFDFCYQLSATQQSPNVPMLNLTMKGGSQYFIQAPTFLIPREGGLAYCLAIVKSEVTSVIGQNFMLGYRIVFDREKMVLGWKESDCSSSIPSSKQGNIPPPVRTFSPVERPTG